VLLIGVLLIGVLLVGVLLVVLIARLGPRLHLQIGPSHGEIGCTDQTRQLRQRIAICL
jgi:hypothetical protein